MDVRCEQCGVVYEFQDERIKDTGITVKCTSCGHIFKVFSHAKKSADTAPRPVAEKPVAAAAAPALTPAAEQKKEPDRRWLIRKPSGEIFKFRELTTLQQWIVEQKVSREDEISRTGKIWERLGAIKELSPFFTVVDKALAAREEPVSPGPAPTAFAPTAEMAKVAPISSAAPTPLETVAPKPAPAPAPRRDLLANVPAEPTGGAAPLEDIGEPSEQFQMGEGVPIAKQEPRFPTGKINIPDSGREAAWERKSEALAATSDPTNEEEEWRSQNRRPGGLGKTLLVVGLGLVVGFGGFMVWTHWDKIKDLLSGKRNPTQGLYYKGRTEFRLDTDASLGRAFSHFGRIFKAQKVSTTDRGNARAAQAEVNAARAQYLKDDADDLRQEAKLLGDDPGGRSAEALLAQAKTKSQAAEDKATVALQYAREAHLMVQNIQTKRALAEAGRVAGRPVSEVTQWMEDAFRLRADDPELYYTKAMLAYDVGDLEKAQKLLRLTIQMFKDKVDKPFFRAQMRLARVYYRRGLRDEAKTVLRSITNFNAGHTRAQQLLDKLTAGSGVVAMHKPVVDAGVPAANPGMGSGMDPGIDPGMHPTKPGPEGDPKGSYDQLVRKGERYSYAGNRALAESYYRKALTARPGGVEALTGLGYCFVDKRQFGQAIRYFRQALGVSSAYGEALIGMAEASQRSGRRKQALSYYKRYVKHHPRGRRAILAKNNIRELEEKLGGSGAVQPPDPRAMEPPTMQPPDPRVTEPPTMRPAPRVMEPPTMRPAPRVVEPPTIRPRPRTMAPAGMN